MKKYFQIRKKQKLKNVVSALQKFTAEIFYWNTVLNYFLHHFLNIVKRYFWLSQDSNLSICRVCRKPTRSQKTGAQSDLQMFLVNTQNCTQSIACFTILIVTSRIASNALIWNTGNQNQ